MSLFFRLIARAAFVLFAGMISASAAHAQFGAEGLRIQSGIFYGNNFATLTNVNADFLSTGGASHKQRRRGQNAAFAVTFPFSERFSLQPEVHYDEEGVTIVSDRDTSGAKLAVRMTYFEVPLLLRADLGSPGARFHPIVVAGASVARRAVCEFEAKTHSFQYVQPCNANESDQNAASNDPFVKWDARIIAGAGLVMNGRGEMYTLQLRWSEGLVNISNTTGQPDFTPRTRAVTVMIGVTK